MRTERLQRDGRATGGGGRGGGGGTGRGAKWLKAQREITGHRGDIATYRSIREASLVVGLTTKRYNCPRDLSVGGVVRPGKGAGKGGGEEEIEKDAYDAIRKLRHALCGTEGNSVIEI